MAFEPSRLRRWLVAAAVILLLTVAGVYFYARRRTENGLKQVPEKIGVDIKQSAKGSTVSKSEQGRTLFKVQASTAIQFKQGARAELHDVEITLYGRDSSRFDQIYGKDFEYDQRSGDITAKGEVRIDLEANPAGLATPDQTPPKELKNPIHLKTRDLVFNQKTGDADTRSEVDFQVAQATGSAVGVKYFAASNLLILQSQVKILLNGATPATVIASHASITKDPRTVVLEDAHLMSGPRRSDAEKATIFLRPDNTIERVLAAGNVRVASEDKQRTQVRSSHLELFMAGPGVVKTAIFSGDVLMEAEGPQPVQGSAGRAVLNFSGENLVTAVHTEENVKLVQHQQPTSSAKSGGAQDFELTAPVVDFRLVEGRRLRHATTSGPPQITIRPTGPNSAGQRTLITAGKFDAGFDDFGQLASLHGAPDARIVTSNPGPPGSVSTSDSVDAAFHRGSGIEAVIQQGNVAYADAERKAWADRARYTPADQVLMLTGSPRVVDGSMTSTARTMRLNRATGDAFADGDVKTTYNDLKPQPNGAMLASSSPIHVTAHRMTAHHSSATALYTGDARLWQDANIVQAPSIEFDRDHRSVTAHAVAAQPVSTGLVQVDRKGKVTPVSVTSELLTYTDNERKAHFAGGVAAKGEDLTLTSNQADVFLVARQQTAANQQLAGPSEIDRVVGEGRVTITQPNRKARGEHLVYTTADDKFVLTGGPPSIFDAEQGKVTGVSLTFFRADDRVLVEGNDTSPTVTHTRVAR